MIKGAGISLPENTYNEIRKYNFGIGIDGDGIDEYLFIRNTALVGMTVAGVAALTVGSFVTNYLIAHIAISDCAQIKHPLAGIVLHEITCYTSA